MNQNQSRQKKPLAFAPGPFGGADREFHIAAAMRKKLGVDDGLFGLSGNVVFADLKAVREFTGKLNATVADGAIFATGDVNAMGLIDEILHYIVSLFKSEYGDDVMRRALEHLRHSIGGEKVNEALEHFVHSFPPTSVHAGKQTAAEFLDSDVNGESGAEVALEEMLLLWVANRNPALAPFAELFGDKTMRDHTAYMPLMHSFGEFFRTQPTFGPESETLVELLRAPAIAHPDSLHDQLSYIRKRWSHIIGDYLFRLLRSLDVIREEQRARFSGPGPTPVLDFSGLADEESERFSEDRDWMPRAVLIAKSTLVWLDQIQRQYGREVKRLDEIPDEELDRLADAGFSGLWLIGLWERSRASKRIKQMCGNPEAEASAYSLMDYQIAEELGGWDALEALRNRCNARGIRLASDMVPNHTGIDSRWIHEHPDWFVQLPYSPFPSYTFNGENLSERDGVGIFLEDHYYDKTDAAVVFKRSDGGGDRYIYHGNDGTSMPWNDTAQLNFLHPDAREAVIQTILHVARNFPIIRFDAAMTLAKRHYQRLWFPQPGTGGDIASRSEHGLTREEFDQAMPVEFWREVVDRVAEEAPDTLLLAEAFWMMEGYFVRTLGMHRVYNSAFMNALKNQENAKYRDTIKNTIQFDKDILKRFVNFMNNPDEETAVAQFGKDDKYFGVCTLMVTMPGLPMFGHGQIEGFTEKYGMEYRRAYLDEQPDEHLIERHRREIFPLQKRRHLFSDVKNFHLYDFFSPDGAVNENVFAYSNSHGDERALIVYNNAYEAASGWIRMSAGYVEKGAGGHKEHLQKSLAEALGLRADPDFFCILHEQRSGKWFIRNSRDLWSNGLFAVLDGYGCQVFLDIYEVEDNAYSHYARLAQRLDGAGVDNIDIALKEVFLEPLYAALGEIIDRDNLDRLRTLIQTGAAPDSATMTELTERYRTMLYGARTFAGVEVPVDPLVDRFEALLTNTIVSSELVLPKVSKDAEHTPAGTTLERKAADEVLADKTESIAEQLALYCLLAPLGGLSTDPPTIVDEWLIDRFLARCCPDRSFFVEPTGNWPDLLRALLATETVGVETKGPTGAAPAAGTAKQGNAVPEDAAAPKGDTAAKPGKTALASGGGAGATDGGETAAGEAGATDGGEAGAGEAGATDAGGAAPADSAADGSAKAEHDSLLAPESIAELLRTEGVASYLRFNTYEDTLWFSKDAFVELAWWLYRLEVAAKSRGDETAAKRVAAPAAKRRDALIEKAEKSGYKVEELLATMTAR